MKPEGWMFMILSWAFIITLNIYAYWYVLRPKKKK